jgi:hypothetical protein
MRKMLKRLQCAANRHPRWASKLTVWNVFHFGLFLAITWAIPYIESDVSATEAARLQWVFGGVAAVILVAFLARTAHDIRRHRQTMELLANEQAVRQAMDQHRRFVTLSLYGERMGFGRPDAALQPTEWQKYQVARAFLRYLATLDTRPWSLNMLRKRYRNMHAATRAKIASVVLRRQHKSADDHTPS